VARPSESDLVRLLFELTETMTVEHKGWLDLESSHARANLAKAAIALANEGGGIIVLGTRSENSKGGPLLSVDRPAEIGRYTVDIINNSISKYSDPEFHCELAFASHPSTKIEHAFVIVPGGMSIPVMSCRGSDGVIHARRCYVRKPGPRSEEPYTSEEWRAVFERCLHARRETMLDAIRAIVSGRIEGRAPSNDRTIAVKELQRFRAKSVERWNALIQTLPKDDPARMSWGRYQIYFRVLGTEPASSLADLRKKIETAGSLRLTGWGPFIDLERPPFRAAPAENGIETWLGHLDDNRFYREPQYCDFWRAEPVGNFFLIRGYDEDSVDRFKPGTVSDITMPVWRVGEPMYFAARIAKLFGSNSRLLFGARYEGLSGRGLVSINGLRSMFGGRKSIDDTFEFTIEATPEQIEDNLAEILKPALAPFYERFDFFQPPEQMVAQELEKLRSKR
jgi:hypothetical protein